MWSRPLPADPSSLRIYRDSLGHWYASFVVPAVVRPLPATARVIGIDWGVKEIATTTADAYDLAHPEHGRKAAARLARYQKMMARRRPPKWRAALQGLPARQTLHPAFTTMDCARCDARTKHALPLGGKITRRTDSAAVRPRVPGCPDGR